MKPAENDAVLFEREAWEKYKTESYKVISFHDFQWKTSAYCALMQRELQSLMASLSVTNPMLTKVISQSYDDWADAETRLLAGIDPFIKEIKCDKMC